MLSALLQQKQKKTTAPAAGVTAGSGQQMAALHHRIWCEPSTWTPKGPELKDRRNNRKHGMGLEQGAERDTLWPEGQ